MSVRSRIAGEAEAQSDKIIEALFRAMDAMRKTWAYCPKCRQKVQVDFPDVNASLKAIELLMEQGYGRPVAGAANAAPEIVGGRETLAQLEALSTNQLAAYVFVSQSEEERARDRRLVEELGATVFPPGFAEALQRLESLSSGTAD